MQSKKVFLSPDVFVAYIDRADPKHLHATALFRYFAQERYVLYVNPNTISTVYQKVSHTISAFVAKDFLKAMSLSTINLLHSEESDVKLVYKTIINYQSTELSFDETLLSVMASRRSIPFICTFSYLHPLFGLSIFYLPI
ncbi:MAG TPA: hypothetical protein VGT05_04520 [Patescibacteria group bacterium]|nr:hypothetical protein [Patescibacteria group bacterium]